MLEKKDVRNIIGAVLICAWAVLLAVLMIRMPVSDLLAGLDVLALDNVLSACFIAIGLAAAVLEMLWHSKPLLLLSLLQAAFLVAFAITACLYVIFFNGDILAIGLYFINPFCAILSCPFWVFALVSAVALLLPIAAGIVYLRAEKSKKAKKSFRVTESVGAEAAKGQK